MSDSQTPDPAPAAVDAPPTTAQKTAATVQRNKAERREERLEDIRAQTANGSLVVRQMTTAEHEVATGVASEVRERSAERKKRYRSPGDRAG